MKIFRDVAYFGGDLLISEIRLEICDNNLMNRKMSSVYAAYLISITVSLRRLVHPGTCDRPIASNLSALVCTCLSS